MSVSTHQRTIQRIRIAAGGEGLQAFARLYLGHRFQLPWSRMHREHCADVHDVGRTPLRLVIGAPDGYGKTTLLSFALILWALAYRRCRCIVLGASTRSGAGDLLGAIDRELRSNRQLQCDFPHLNDVARCSGASGSRASPPRLIEVPGIAKVTTIGPSSRLGEIGFEGRPPELFVLDGFDAGADGNAEPGGRRTRVDVLERFVQRRILHRFTDASVIVAGALTEADGLIDRLLAPSRRGVWTQRFYRAVEAYPAQFDRWFEWAALRADDPEAADRFLTDHREELLAGAQVLWPQRESFERLMRLRSDLGWTWFDTYRQGLPPGGSLRSGGSRSLGLDPCGDARSSTVIDDAGYRRAMPTDPIGQPEVIISVENGENVGKAVPTPATEACEAAF